MHRFKPRLTTKIARVDHPASPVASIDTPPSTPSIPPNTQTYQPHHSNKSVNFAPLPIPSSHTAKDGGDSSSEPEISHQSRSFHDRKRKKYDDNVFDDPSSPSSPDTSKHHRRHHRRRHRRNSDPSSDRPSRSSKHHTRTRDPSPNSSDEIEELPARFDRDGRPLTRGAGRDMNSGGHQEMVERIAKDFTEVIDGRKSWKDLLRGLVEQTGAAEAFSSGSGGERERRRRRD